MTLRCDHCRGKLGVIVHTYWRMRFCSAACRQAYEQRLDDVTRAKVRRLDHDPRHDQARHDPRHGRGLASRFFADVTRRLAG